MVEIVEPQVGSWYQCASDESEFEVVAFEPDEDCVEIQYFDGTVESIDLESWYAMDLSYSSQPEDWSGAYDDIERSEMDASSSQPTTKWSSPLRDADFD